MQAVADALRGLIRDHVQAALPDGKTLSGVLDLELRVRIDPGANWSLHCEPSLMEQIDGQIEERLAAHAIFVKGHVHCFRCESSYCEHSQPPGPEGVFAGFSAQGAPRWSDLTQVFIDLRDPRVDQLYGDRPRVVTRVQMGRDLRGDQLRSHGKESRSYSILGQVVAGRFLVRPAGGERRRNVSQSITFQVVESRGPGGRFKLELNPLAWFDAWREPDEFLASGCEPWVYRAYRIAARAITGIEGLVGRKVKSNRGCNVLGKVPAVLQALARDLERGQSQAHRRTRHVEERRSQQRPVHKALDDVAASAMCDIYLDEKTRNFIVCGSHGRAHAFSEFGRHVTSFVLKADAADFRVRTHRWSRMESDAASAVKETIQNAAASPARKNE